jgi:predicted O-linked N-acetylglucosamine transferase (SPINDLY family)
MIHHDALSMASVADAIARKAGELIDSGNYSEAQHLLEQQLTDLPGHEASVFLLGKLLGLQGEHLRAVGVLEKLVATGTDRLDAIFTFAVELGEVGRYQDALNTLGPLLECYPELPFLRRWQGVFLEKLRRVDEAQQAYLTAIQLKPDYVEAQISLASLWLDQCHVEEAEKKLVEILEQHPDNGTAHNDLGRIYRMQGKIPQALFHFQRVMEIEPSNAWAASNYLFALCNLETVSAEELAARHFQLADRYYPVETRTNGHRLDTNRAIRIGYLSGDFCTHSVSFFIEAILQHHDRSRFKLYCYATTAKSDDTTLRLKSMDVVWRDICGQTAAMAAQKIRDDEIDILVDLSGHTSGNRLDLFARRPAPVQVSWIGYPHSTGLRQMDYYISDRICNPPETGDSLYSESLIRLPRVFCCYLPPVVFPQVAPLPFSSNGQITFGCFNSFSKINQALFETWVRILKAIPGSRLYLKSAPLSGDGVKLKVLETFEKSGIVAERITLKPFAESPEQHLAQYADIDIALDTYPYNGTTTTCESLWMGVPLISLAGDRHLSRVGASFLQAVGLPELVADSPDEYVEKAVNLALDSERLQFLRENLRLMMARSALMDAKGVTCELEQAYESMFVNAQRVDDLKSRGF